MVGAVTPSGAEYCLSVADSRSAAQQPGCVSN